MVYQMSTVSYIHPMRSTTPRVERSAKDLPDGTLGPYAATTSDRPLPSLGTAAIHSEFI